MALDNCIVITLNAENFDIRVKSWYLSLISLDWFPAFYNCSNIGFFFFKIVVDVLEYLPFYIKVITPDYHRIILDNLSDHYNCKKFGANTSFRNVDQSKYWLIQFYRITTCTNIHLDKLSSSPNHTKYVSFISF